MKKEQALGAFRELIAFHRESLKEGSGYMDDSRLIYLNRDQAETALRYGIPIGMHSVYCGYHGSNKGDYDYTQIRDGKMLEKYLSNRMYEDNASIHAYLPRDVQEKMLGYLRQIMELEAPSGQTIRLVKPTAPLIGEDGNIFNLMRIAARTLRHAGQGDRADEMWKRITQSGDYYKALAVLGEYVEFGEVPQPEMEQQTESCGMKMEL
jgi:hypothetical protein